MPNILEAQNLVKQYGDFTAVKGISFDIKEGEIFSLLGPNGAGKTTLFSLITRLYDRQSGAISVFGSDLRQDPTTALSNIGVVFQQRTLDLDLTVLQNLRYAAALHGLARGEARARIAAEIERAGLAGKANEKVRRLSGGETRRVEIARAMLHHPALLLCDEATVGLDIPGRQAILDRVRALSAEDSVAVLWATHLIDEVRPVDRVILLHRGRILADGPADEIAREADVASMGEAFTKLTRAAGA